MDAVVVVDGLPDAPRASCRLLRSLAMGDRVVCGIEGIRIHPTRVPAASETFGFMTAETSSGRRVELAVDRIAWGRRRLRDRGGESVVVAGPGVSHTGGARPLARPV